MIALAKISALLSIFYLVRVLLYPIFRPISRKQRKRTRQFMKNKKSEDFKERMIGFKKRIASRYVKNLISSIERTRFKKIIDRLDLNKKPEEIRTEQFLYTIAAVVVTIIMFFANVMLGCVTAIFIVLGWLYPIVELEKIIERKNTNIALDFPAFYSMIYYQYSKSVNIHLADVIKDYIPNANADMAEELGVMLDNMDYGEAFALKQFKKRVPVHYVIKFCDIIETRLRGYNNVSQMAYLKNEVDEFRIRALETELERRESQNARVQMVLIVVLLIYIALYYLFMVLSSLRLFQ